MKSNKYLLLLAATVAVLVLGHSNPVAAGETRVNTYTLGTQGDPSVAVDADGDFVVTWESLGQGPGTIPLYDIYAQRFNSSGSPVGGEISVTATSWAQQNPAVAMDKDGNFTIVYENDFNTGTPNFEIWGKRYNSSGGFLGNLLVTNDPSAQLHPSITMSGFGNFVVAWDSSDGEGTGIFAKRYKKDGNSNGAKFQVNSTSLGNQKNPSIAMNNYSNFIVAWEDQGGQDGDGYGIFAQMYNTSGSLVNSEIQVNSTTAGNQTNPSAAMAYTTGRSVVVWESASSGNLDTYDIHAQRINLNGSLAGNEFVVNTTLTGYQGRPSVAMDPVGNFVVSWASQGQDGSYHGVYARKYDWQGNPLSGEFLVNTTTTGSQSYPAVAGDLTGKFVTAWQGPDGNGDGVFMSWPIILGCTDLDGDGFGVGAACLGADCNDGDASINPTALEVCDDGIDNNCNGIVDTDDDDCEFPPDIYVDDCSGSGDGSYGNPFCKIQDAIVAASGGDVILVRDGTYYENIDFLGKSIVLRSQSGPETTIIDANNKDTVVMFLGGETRSTVLKGFTIQHGNGWGHNAGGRLQKDAGGIKCYQSSPTISDCIIKNNSVVGVIGSPVRGGGIQCNYSASPAITNCIIVIPAPVEQRVFMPVSPPAR